MGRVQRTFCFSMDLSTSSHRTGRFRVAFLPSAMITEYVDFRYYEKIEQDEIPTNQGFCIPISQWRKFETIFTREPAGIRNEIASVENHQVLKVNYCNVEDGPGIAFRYSRPTTRSNSDVGIRLTLDDFAKLGDFIRELALSQLEEGASDEDACHPPAISTSKKSDIQPVISNANDIPISVAYLSFVEDFPLSPKAAKTMTRLGVTVVGDLIRIIRSGPRELVGVDTQTINEIIALLESAGLSAESRLYSNLLLPSQKNCRDRIEQPLRDTVGKSEGATLGTKGNSSREVEAEPVSGTSDDGPIIHDVLAAFLREA